ncbi:glycosyltransferase family 47 protein [Gramella sp. GC03-9]|uniref:Glycosyltransferase family 47 protein n=1 Tax=Christiangramia oceanisediminis TaxID=2920386 RepID=A0A9X2I492_9FLAO|nr:exostosin family protein [Gramella oceanisediminis]MCP9199570.1 glycosyltransferase family 47 protein [Gramella oceanisediminis]
MKLLYLDSSISRLADPKGEVLKAIKMELGYREEVQEVFSPEMADAIIIQERSSFKNFRYRSELLADPVISEFPHKVFTLNSEDSATGLLKGLYTSLPRERFNSTENAIVPFMQFPNEYVFERLDEVPGAKYLASWRGNVKSNKLRRKLLELYQDDNRFLLETTNSWLNHSESEKRAYVRLILQSKFSLCPAGWAPVSFRIYESMALGRCPVIIADSYVPPAGPEWEKFSLFFPERKINRLASFLKENEYRAEDLGKKAFEAWEKYFNSDCITKYYADAVLALIKSNSELSRAREIERWNSLKLQWENGWTIPQRALNKIRNLKAFF